LWPSELKQRPISFDLDFVESRKRDLLLGNKTDYDEQVANVVTDYVDLAKQLESATNEEINYILDRYASSNNTIGKTRQYKELLRGRFRITKVVRIDLKDDGNDVETNIFDYSRTTIEKLMQDGYRDASIKMGIESMKDEFFKLNEK
jgi:NTE family protein